MKSFQADIFFQIAQILEGWINDLLKQGQGNLQLPTQMKLSIIGGKDAFINGLQESDLPFLQYR